MKGLRSIMPRLAVALCSGFLVFTVSCAVFAENKDRQDLLHQVSDLAFQSIDLDGSSLFTRQAEDSEAESHYGIVRHDCKCMLQSMQLEYSRIHSVWTNTQWIDIVRTSPATQHLPVLFQRLLI